MTGNELKNMAERNGILRAVDCFHTEVQVELPMYEDFLQLPIDELNLSVRAYNGLMRANISTVQKLVNALSEEYGLDHIRNLGKKSICEIKRALLTESYNWLTDAQKERFWEYILERNAA